MARIAGVDIPREKKLGTSLTYIYGIGSTAATKVCEATGIDTETRVRDLTDEEVARLRNWIDANLKVEETSAGTSPRTSSARWRSGPTRASATAGVFPSTASAPTPTHEPARAPRRPSPVRRRFVSTNTDPKLPAAMFCRRHRSKRQIQTFMKIESNMAAGNLGGR